MHRILIPVTLPVALSVVLSGALLLTACHNAHRESPLDPELTPAPVLQAALEDSAGVVQLSWQPYDGDTDFAAWWILRNQVNSLVVDTLAVLDSMQQVTFTDTTPAPDTRYEYRVSAVNGAGFEAPSIRQIVAGYSLAPVRTVTATPDSLAAVIRLNWPVYAGPGFSAYHVVRRQVGTDQTDTLATLESVAQTSFGDSTAQHDTIYRYTILTDAAGMRLAGAQVETALRLAPPIFETLAFESASATAQLTWQPYAGAHFSCYVVSRRDDSGAEVALARIEDISVTEYADDNLRGNVSYSYRVAVETTRGEVIASTQRSGSIHSLVDSWDVVIDWDGSLQATVDARGYGNQFDVGERIFVRLEGGDQASGVRLWEETPGALERRYRRHAIRQYSRDGNLLDFEALPISLPNGGGLGDWYGAAAMSDAARHIVIYHGPSGSTTLYRSDAMGARLFEETEILSLSLSGAAPAAVMQLQSLGRMTGFSGLDLQIDDTALPLIEGERRESYGDGSSIDPPPDWTGNLVESWTAVAEPLEGDPLVQWIGLLAGGHARRDYGDAAWQDVELRVTLVGDTEGEWESTITLGDSSEAALALVRTGERILLTYEAGDGSAPQSVSLARPVADVETFILRLSNGAARLVQYSDIWLTAELPLDQTTLIAHGLEDGITFAVGPQPYYLSSAGELSAIGAGFDSRITEIRARDQRLGQWMGVALPDERQVRFGVVRSASQDTWASRLTQSIGPQVNDRNRMFSYPISFDFSPDGRIYILDAAVATIYVYDVNRRQYITEFGGLGSGPGQFDFGPGTRGSDGEFNFRGSVAVDDEGYVYVADINQRVQVFAP